MAGAATMQVTGCQDQKIGPMVRGSFRKVSENHQRPVYQRGQEAVHVYFWDERDGDAFCGWWFGPSVGGDQVWAYHPNRAMTPPTTGWYVPFGGEMDMTLVLRFGAAAAAQTQQQQQAQQAFALQQQQLAQVQQQKSVQPRAHAQLAQGLRPQVNAQQQAQMQAQKAAQQQKLQAQQLGQQQKRQAEMEKQKARQEELKKNREAMVAQQEKARGLQKEMGAIRTVMQKLRTVTADTIEQVRKEVDDQIQEEMPKLSPDAANLLFEEYQGHIDFAEKRVEQLKEQKRKNDEKLAELARLRAEHAENNTQQQVDVPPEAVPNILGKQGSTLKRLIRETGCNIECPTAWPANGTPVAVNVRGNTKQRRLAVEALHIIADGGDADDVHHSARGTLVVPHGLTNPAKEKWLQWRLRPLEREHKLKVVMAKKSLRVLTQEGATPLTDGSDHRNTIGALVEACVEEAFSLVELSVNAKKELEPTDEKMTAAIRPWVEQYGILVKALEAEEEIVPVGVLGPPDACRDAAALLWAKFNQGKSTMVVLQVPNRLQSATELQAKDLNVDLRSLEEECEVELTQTATALWASGAGEETVVEARQMLIDMMQFYFAEDFYLLEGLDKAGMAKLKDDVEFSALRQVEGCAVTLYPDEGAAWLCGPKRGPAQKRIEALAKAA